MNASMHPCSVGTHLLYKVFATRKDESELQAQAQCLCTEKRHKELRRESSTTKVIFSPSLAAQNDDGVY